jgi:hypothetical protein
VLLCPACRARQASALAPTPAPEPRPSPGAPPSGADEKQRSSPARSGPNEDRLRKALRELDAGEYAIAQIAKAAGLNHEKTLRRLRALQDAGEIQQVGNKWSNRPPSTDLDEAMDRLRAQTSNLRIVTPRSN